MLANVLLLLLVLAFVASVIGLIHMLWEEILVSKPVEGFRRVLLALAIGKAYPLAQGSVWHGEIVRFRVFALAHDALQDRIFDAHEAMTCDSCGVRFHGDGECGCEPRVVCGPF